jgi:uncharacterized protein
MGSVPRCDLCRARLVIAVDTNILVHAHRSDSEWNDMAFDALRKLASGKSAWAIPWPCIYEFFSVVTHPKIFRPPSKTEAALLQIDAWLESPRLVLLGESTDHWLTVRDQLRTARVVGAATHDAKIAALCSAHGVKELWTADRDFGRFKDLKTKNPLL